MFDVAQWLAIPPSRNPAKIDFTPARRTPSWRADLRPPSVPAGGLARSVAILVILFRDLGIQIVAIMLLRKPDE